MAVADREVMAVAWKAREEKVVSNALRAKGVLANPNAVLVDANSARQCSAPLENLMRTVTKASVPAQIPAGLALSP